MVDTSGMTDSKSDSKMSDSKKSKGSTSGAMSSGAMASGSTTSGTASGAKAGSMSGSGASFDRSEGMASSMNDSGEGFVNHPHIAVESRGAEQSSKPSFGGSDFGLSRYLGEARHLLSSMREIPGSSRAIFSSVDQHARQNPWMHIGLAGFGALLLGYAFGRGFSDESSSVLTSDTGSRAMSGSTRGASSSVGDSGARSSYERFDDAIDE